MRRALVEEEFRRLRKVHADNSCERDVFATADSPLSSSLIDLF